MLEKGLIWGNDQWINDEEIMQTEISQSMMQLSQALQRYKTFSSLKVRVPQILLAAFNGPSRKNASLKVFGADTFCL